MAAYDVFADPAKTDALKVVLTGEPVAVEPEPAVAEVACRESNGPGAH